MKSPLVSIIILSALRKACTQRCLESINKFTLTDHEVIIVDMGIDKNIKKWLVNENKKHNNLKLILNKKNVGTSKGRNQGIKIARGKYIVFLDNDIILTRHWLDALIETFKKQTKGALIGSKITCPNKYVYICDRYVYDRNENGQRKIGLKVTRPFRDSNPEINIEREVPWYPTGCLMANRNLINELNGFDEKLFSIEEDKDLCLRAKKIGKKIIYCPRSYVIHNRIRDDFYEKEIRYKSIHRLKKDISYFESKWNCKVELIYSKKAIKSIGYSEIMINQMTNGRLKDLFGVT